MAKATSKKEASNPDVAVEHIALASLYHSPTNPRKTYPERELSELAQSIRANGIINPITVRPIGALCYEVVAGNRRFRAAQIAELETVPCIVRDLTDDQVMDIQIAENLHRQDVPPLEEAAAFEAMLKTRKIDIHELSGKIGKSAAYVYKRLRLNNLHEKYREHLETGDLPTTTAEIIASYPEAAQLAIYKNSHWKREDSSVVFDVAKKIKERLGFESCTDLSRALFDLDEENMQPGLTSCSKCPKNTAVATMLFPDDQANPRCTDKSCWKIKEKVYIAIQVKMFAEHCAARKTKPVFCTLWYTMDEETKYLEALLGFKPEVLGQYGHEFCDPDEEGAMYVMFVGGRSYTDDGENTRPYTTGWVKKSESRGPGYDYHVEQIKKNPDLDEDQKEKAIAELMETRKKERKAQELFRKQKRWKERIVRHVIETIPITSITHTLLKLWLKRLGEGELNGWWKYVFGKQRLLNWRPESFPSNQEFLEGKEAWDTAVENCWVNCINTFESDRDRTIWARWIDDEYKEAFILDIANTATREELDAIHARCMMVEIYQSETSWNGTGIDVEDYEDLLDGTGHSTIDFEAEPEKVEQENTDGSDEEDEFGEGWDDEE